MLTCGMGHVNCMRMRQKLHQHINIEILLNANNLSTLRSAFTYGHIESLPAYRSAFTYQHRSFTCLVQVCILDLSELSQHISMGRVTYWSWVASNISEQTKTVTLRLYGSPSTCNHRSPFTYRDPRSYRNPFTYNHRSPFTYRDKSVSESVYI